MTFRRPVSQSQRVSEAIERVTSDIFSAVQGYVAEAVRQVLALDKAGLVILVDGADKIIRGSSRAASINTNGSSPTGRFSSALLAHTSSTALPLASATHLEDDRFHSRPGATRLSFR